MVQEVTKEMSQEAEQYHTVVQQKEMIVRRMKERGCRITKQRMILLDVILGSECSCCKEIYYKASKLDSRIGSATVYRMINTLEEIGAISRKNMYKVSCSMDCAADCGHACTIELEDGSKLQFSEQKMSQIIQSGLAACGYAVERKGFYEGGCMSPR
mgnify:CR=1 FL=1